MDILTVTTSRREEFVEITGALRKLVRERDWRDGALVMTSAHTTCGLTVNENADPDVARDMLARLRFLAPREGDYRHAEGNSDAHVKTTLTGVSLTLIVDGGELVLGTWQGVYLCEFDGPRTRRVNVLWLDGA